MAKSQDEWMELAQKIDIIQGNNLWRTKKDCPLYESDKIQARIDKFVSVKIIICVVTCYSEINAKCMFHIICQALLTAEL